MPVRIPSRTPAAVQDLPPLEGSAAKKPATSGDGVGGVGPRVELPRVLPRVHALDIAGDDGNHAAFGAVLALAAVPAAVLAVAAPGSAHATTESPEIPRATAASLLFADASTAATPTAVTQDSNVQELVTKLTRLINSQFNGNARAAFNHYAGSDGQVNRSELGNLLRDAGVGNGFTRGFWIDGIMERVDGAPNGNGNGTISWSEFNRVLNSGTA